MSEIGIDRTVTGQFKKGVSGNPGGRPAALEEVRDLARQETAASIHALAKIRDDGRAPAQARVAASVALLDRGWGRPAQTTTIEVTERFAFELPAEAASEAEWLAQKPTVQ
jgi:Family of unknown function (DUF5681)